MVTINGGNDNLNNIKESCMIKGLWLCILYAWNWSRFYILVVHIIN